MGSKSYSVIRDHLQTKDGMLYKTVRAPLRISLFVVLTIAPAMALAEAPPKDGSNAEKLEPIMVTGEAAAGLTAPSLSKSREHLSHVPGGTDLTESEEYKIGRMGGLEDMLAFTPGVYGNGEAEVLVRGSGLAHSFSMRGVWFLRNGLPLNNADGAIGVSQLTPYPFY